MRPENKEVVDYRAVGRWIAQLRITHGWTKRRLSELTNIEEGALGNYARGSKRIGLTPLVLIARCFDVSVDWILFGTEGPENLDEDVWQKYQLLDEEKRKAIERLIDVM